LHFAIFARTLSLIHTAQQRAALDSSCGLSGQA
jgi:hypothetical protein